MSVATKPSSSTHDGASRSSHASSEPSLVVPELNYFPPPNVAPWLSVLDARLSLVMLHALGAARGDAHRGDTWDILEIGVYRGAWTAVLLANMRTAHVTGIDPYPDAPETEESMHRYLHSVGVADRFTHHATLEALPASVTFDLIHVDGAHDEESARTDLAAAARRLRPGGVLIVDDYRNFKYPGVASALHEAYRVHDLRPFLLSEGKAYVAHSADAPELRATVRDLLASATWVDLFDDTLDSAVHVLAYAEPADVLGQPVLLAQGGHLRAPRARQLATQLRPWLPPVVFEAVRTLFIRRAWARRRRAET